MLRDAILKSSFPWVLSYDHHERIVEMYAGRRCSLYLNHIRHTITGNTNAEELIISRLDFPDYLEPIGNPGNWRNT
jgi:hypothetical protein